MPDSTSLPKPPNPSGQMTNLVKKGAGPTILGARHLFEKKNPGSPGKLGKSSTKAESLSKLRGKGALA